MKYRVEIQPAAFQEIEDAYRWICDNLGTTLANRWYYDLQNTLDSLQKFPNRGLIAPEAEVFDREIRQLWVGKRRVDRLLYVVERGVVSILHARHSRQPPLSEL